ncbi:MAG: hypothetical protein AB1441_01385 [Bacillota bacterium]
MNRLTTLYLKELNGNWVTIAGAAAVIVLLNLFLHFQSFWESGAALGFGMSAVSLLIIVTFWFATALDREWTAGTAYWLLSLPVSGYTVLTAKFGLALTFLAPNLLLALGGVYLALWWTYGILVQPTAAALVYGYFLGLGTMAALLGLLARTAGLAVRRGRPAVAVGVFFAGVWLLRVFVRLMNEWLSFLPSFTVPTGISWYPNPDPYMPETAVSLSFGELSLATVLAWAVYGAGVFFLTGRLLDRRVEI